MKNLLILIICLLLSLRAYSKANDTIRFVGDNAFPPFEYIDKDGNARGVNIDIINHIMKKINRPYTITLKPWNEVLKYFDNGSADIITGMNFSNKRAKKYKFGAVHAFIFQDIITRKSDSIYRNLSQLKDRVLILEKDAISNEIAADYKCNKNAIYVTDIKKALIELSRGKYDAAICDHDMAINIIKENNLNNLDTYSVGLPPQEYRFVGKNDSLLDVIDLAYFELNKKGVIEQINQKWIMNDKSLISVKYLLLVIGFIIIGASILFTFIAILRNKVRDAREDISRQNNHLTMAMRAGNLKAWRYDIKKKVFFNIEGNNISQDGYTLDDLVKNIHPDERNKYRNIIEHAIMGIIPDKTICFRANPDKDGNYRYIDKEFSVETSSDGVLKSIIGTNKDVTEIVTIRRSLEDNIKKMQLAANFSNTVFWEYEHGTNYLQFDSIPISRYNGNHHKINANEVTINTHPDDKKKNIEFFKEISKGENDIVKTDVRLLSKDGKEWRHCRTNAVAFKHDKETRKVLLYVGFTYDYTDLFKLNEKVNEYAMQLDHIMASSNSRLWRLNIKENKLTVRKGERVSVYGPDEMVMLCGDDEKIKDLLKKMQAGKINDFNGDGTYFYKGKKKYALYSGIVIRESGEAKEYFGSIVDISDLKLTQIKLEEEKEKAQQSDRLKSAFISNMSHEIRTPLNIITGFSSIIADTDDKTLQKECSIQIKINSNNLLKLLEDILDLAKMESEAIVYNYQPTDICGLCYDIIKSTSLNNPNELEITLDNENECIISTDKVRLNQVIINFLSNALKFTSKGSIHLGYNLIDDDHIKIYVKDTGCGIKDDDKQKIFDRFVKVNSFIQGTGLGLSICKTIAQQMGGSIGVDSTFGEGSTFWIITPTRNDYLSSSTTINK